MRIDVKKFLFIGVEQDREAFFAKAQEAGVIHFIEGGPATIKNLPDEIGDTLAAIKILRGLPPMEQEEIEEFALADGLVHKILQFRHRMDKLHEEERLVRSDIARVHAFGDFSQDDIAYIEREGNRKIQFYFSKRGVAAETPLPDEVLYVGSEHELDYFVAINKQPTQYPGLVEMRIDLPLGRLEQRQKAIAHELHDTERRLKGYEKYNTFLHQALVHQLNTFYLKSAKNGSTAILDDSLFVTTGWVPVTKINEVEKVVANNKVQMEEIAIEPEDKVPTYLENEGAHRIGEDVMRIYDTPSINDKDPSIWVLVSFAFFFAFIIGDGGYGFIFLAAALYIQYKNKGLRGWKHRFVKLIMILGVSCIGWGLLTNSFFGIEFSQDSPIKKVSVLNWLVEKKAAYHFERKDEVYHSWTKKIPELESAKDPHDFLEKGSKTYPSISSEFSSSIMMELALMIGVIHIIISMSRYLTRNWVNLGWILFIIGGYLFCIEYLGATSILNFAFNMDPNGAAPNGHYLMYGGLAIAVVVSIYKHKFLGLLEVMTAVQIFADIMSYLRLYALSLAGSMVTSVMNETASQIPFILAIVLLIFGHIINLTLSIMSGVIHGLRLNFLEWYHYSFEGGGRRFVPLEKMSPD